MKKCFLILFMLIALSTAYAQEEIPATAAAFGVKEIKTIDLYFGYLPQINKNTFGYAMLNFTPIDGVSRVLVANVRIIEEQSGSSTLEVFVNSTPCNTPNITSYLTGKTQYVADFECSNVINTSGIYVVGIRPSEIIYNVHFRAWITYENNPEVQINETINYIISSIINATDNSINNNIDEMKILLFDSPETKRYCEDNNTLIITKTANITLGNKTYPYYKTEKIYCEFGCDQDRKQCNYPNWIYLLIIFGVITVSYFVVKHVILPLMG
ncbi:MAG: hypothetical protein QW795_03470 [Candidatus Bathyarchaeia archaeon]